MYGFVVGTVLLAYKQNGLSGDHISLLNGNVAWLAN